jgi:hypothetical protein
MGISILKNTGMKHTTKFLFNQRIDNCLVSRKICFGNREQGWSNLGENTKKSRQKQIVF